MCIRDSRKRVGIKRKNTEQDQPEIRFIFHLVYSRGNRTPGSEKRQTLVYLIKRKMKKKILVYVPGTYISPFVELQFTRNPANEVAADCLAAPRRNFEADSAAAWQRAPPLDHVKIAAVRAAWHES